MRFFLLLSFLLFNFSLAAQEQESKQEIDVIYFKDGNVIKGKILDNYKKAYRIEMLSGDVITVSKKNVSTTKSISLKDAIFIEDGLILPTKGYYGIYAINLLTGSGTYNYGEIAPSLSMIHGHQFDHNLSLGLGISVDFYGYTIIPVFLDIRGYPRKKRLSPFYALDVGYGFPVWGQNSWTNIKGGLMLNPSLGLRFLGRRKSSFQLGIGYKKQFISRNYVRQDYSDQIVFNRLQLNLGLMF